MNAKDQSKKVNLKTKILRAILFFGTAVSLFFVPWLLVKAWILPLPNSIQEQLEEAVDHGLDGIIVYVDQAGKPPGLYAAGWHDRDAEIPANPNALFKIASISNLYTAVSITKLVKDGRLSLDKTLADYFPELSDRIEYADQITVRLMVQHRSGIPNFTDAPDFWAAPTETAEASLALILDKPASFEPDNGYEYSNTNYLLLSLLIENTVGYGKQQFINEEILDPLNLKNTFGPERAINLDNMMSGYHVGYPFDLKGDGHDMVATAEDIGIFLRSLNDGSVFEEGEQEIYSSIYLYEHSGWVPGYQSFAEYDEELDAVVVLFNNTTDSKLYLWNLSEIIHNRIIKILEDQS